jgi:hypothetical protein
MENYMVYVINFECSFSDGVHNFYNVGRIVAEMEISEYIHGAYNRNVSLLFLFIPYIRSVN